MILEKDKSISKINLFINKIVRTIGDFSLTEKLIFWFLILVLIGASLSYLFKINTNYLQEIPKNGGTLKEGLLGTPRFINPIIAISDTDRDIASLVYAGLIKIDSRGNQKNELAKSVDVSEDGLIYNVKIKDDAFFHDGKPVTADDVIFTIQKTQDSTTKSPKRPNWDGVVIEKINEKELEFILNQPYTPFIHNLTLGILPKHIWENITSDEFAFSQFNLEPVGSGPYVISKISTDSNNISKRYVLESYENYVLGEPFIKKIEFFFYKNESEMLSAFDDEEITSFHGVSPTSLQNIDLKKSEIREVPLSRVFAIFLNQAKNTTFTDKTAREALNLIMPKEKIIDEILSGYGTAINSPIPFYRTPYEPLASEDEIEYSNKKQQAIELLENNDWSLNENGIYEKETEDSISTLSFSLSTANVEELVKVAELIRDSLKEVGIEVNLKIFEPNDLTLNVIRPREFESILFGQVISGDLDLYGFWHSSQRNDPGLNIAGYANIDADSLLDKIRTLSDENEINELLQKFEKEVINDVPAIFLYSPDFIYVVSKDLKGAIPNSIITSSDRFADIEKWFIETDLVWKIFAD